MASEGGIDGQEKQSMPQPFNVRLPTDEHMKDESEDADKNDDVGDAKADQTSNGRQS